MQSPTTSAFDRAVAKQNYDPAADHLAIYRESAAKQLGEEVIDACMFSRPWTYGSDAIASHFGFVAQLALRKVRTIQAGGLPGHFLLVVTPTDVVALERKLTPRGGALGKSGDEVARWRRADITVSWKLAGYLYNATIESPGEGERVKCCVGKADISEAFLRLLADPRAMSPVAVA